MVNKPGLTLTSNSETTHNNSNQQQLNMTRRGSKRARQCDSESASEPEISGTNQLNDNVLVLDLSKKPGSRPVSPSKPDDIKRPVYTDTGRPGSSGQRKAEVVEPIGKKATPSSPPDVEPSKEACRSGRPRKNQLKRSSPSDNILADEAVRGRRKERAEKSDTSAQQYEPSAKSEDSFDALLLKVEETVMATCPHDAAGPSSRSHKRKHDVTVEDSVSKSSSYSRKPAGDGKSSAKSDSAKSESGKSSGRSSVQSMESLDGHTELLESLVHAAHAEDKLRNEKEDLQQRNNMLEQELFYALKVVDKLKTKCKYASRIRHDMKIKLLDEKAKLKKQLQAEKAELKKQLQASLKQEKMASKAKKDKSAAAQKRD